MYEIDKVESRNTSLSCYFKLEQNSYEENTPDPE